MSRDAAMQDLLYVSNAKDQSVDVYSYPADKLKGRLSIEAQGLCSDTNGDVFILEGNEVLEYPHGGTQPLAILRNSLGGVSQFCSVDPTTGNLAVSGGLAHKYGVAIYTSAKGDPRIYVDGDGNRRYWSCTFDDNGDVFAEVTAGNSSTAVNFVELPNGGEYFRNVTWNATPGPPLGSIQWDGKYLALESPASGSQPATIFRYSFSRTQATLVGKTALTHALPQEATISLAPAQKIAVTTYHYDNLRTGWNHQETSLTQETVAAGSFGLLHTATLDDQVDTQPLIVPDETTTAGVAPGVHDVVYVATESNTVYAIDASSGTVLFQRSLGNPVSTPLHCNNSGQNVGIDGTPVVDGNANAMYVIAYTLQGTVPTYYIHELSLSNLTDIVAPVLVSASHTLSDGNTFTFKSKDQRQRSGLLEANGSIYAGFASFCDFSASKSRGWVLGWQAGSLTPLPANRMNDTLYTSPNSFFLSSVWMSGYGLAADELGNIYFATGNSDPSGTTYNSVTNLSESVAKVSSDLTTLISFFTPSDVGKLDKEDEDTGSGGALLLPSIKGSGLPLAAAAGKAGTLFLLNRNSLGGYTLGGPNNDLGEQQIGGCWCGQSYFDAASDSVRRIVASGGNTVTVWKVPNPPSLVEAGSSSALPGNQDPGFFTTVSSNGPNPGAIIWALARPEKAQGYVTLFAFTAEPSSGSTLGMLYSAHAGSWQSPGANANLVPVVANGKVYVASYKQIAIFGLLGANEKPETLELAAGAASSIAVGAPHEVTGTLVAISGTQITLRTRTGKFARVDDAGAVRAEQSAVLVLGKPFTAEGTYKAGILNATVIVRAKPSPAIWPMDV